MCQYQVLSKFIDTYITNVLWNTYGVIIIWLDLSPLSKLTLYVYFDGHFVSRSF